ncbi:MAG: carbon storage regulator CsrA [Fusobacteriaceae bacterium]|jgi:carbon storage regulator|nr:carbon storage regulator CsrA [Fusobacteriaceae bacterium]MBN2837391.1 carbon storage regulator CsrA [Fusobacteriaceae bacterium]
MLVLSRKKNESIMIGDDIEIVVVEIKGDQVKLGVKAPKNITVHRAEVYEEIQQENKKASSVPKQITGLGSLFSQFKKK